MPHRAGSRASGPHHGGCRRRRPPARGGTRSFPPRGPRLQYVGLDEKAIRKGHRYATIMTDIEGGAVIDVVEERMREATPELFSRLPEQSLRGIVTVAMDMWRPSPGQ